MFWLYMYLIDNIEFIADMDLKTRFSEIDKRCLKILKHFSIFAVNYTGEYDLVIGGPPGVWNGPPAVLYRSFDTLTGLGLMAGSGASNYDALVPGKVN